MGAARRVAFAIAAYGLAAGLACAAGGGHALRFATLNSDQGLSENTVTSFAEDPSGFIWIGTQHGLNRYDGVEFKVFRAGHASSADLVEDYVNVLHVDRAGVLWVGTFAGGLSRYDPASGRFENHLHDPHDPATLAHNDVSALYEDARGALWVGTRGGGLDRIELASGRIEHVAIRDADGAGSTQVSAIASDGADGLWVGTLDAGLFRLDARRQVLAHHRAGAESASPLASDDVSALSRDGAGNVWIGTRRNGLARIGADGRFARYRHDAARPASLAHDAVNALFADSAGTLWIATSNGLDEYDAARDGFRHNQNEPRDPYTVPYSGVLAVYRDSLGNVWIGTDGRGAARHVPPSGQFEILQHDERDPESLSSSGIWSVLEDKSGALWIGTYDSGLNVRARDATAFSRYRYAAADPTSLSDDDVRALLEDGDDRLFVATRRGLDRLDRKRGRFERFLHGAAPDSLAHDFVRSLLRDATGRVWIGTYGGGLDRWLGDGRFAHLRHDDADPASLSDDRVYCLAAGRDGAIWVGTHGGGLNRLDPESGRSVRFRHDPRDPGTLAGDRVLALYEDRSGALWVGTSSGLDRFDAASGRFEHHDDFPNRVIYGIEEDESGRLWISTNDGVLRFDPKTRDLRHYPLRDRLLSAEFNGGASNKGPSGRIYFGGVDGVVVITPGFTAPELAQPRPVLTEMLAFNRPLAPHAVDADSPLHAPIDRVGNVELGYRQSMFGFRFAALHAADPMRNRFQYRLEGLDERWIDADARHRSATYTNVPAGRYRFRVRASDAEGRWLPDEASVGVVVLPPPWRTPWAYLGYLIIVAAFVAAWVRQRRIRKAQRARAQRALMESEERFSLALWGSGDEMLDWNLVTGTMVRVGGESGRETRVARGLFDVEALRAAVNPEDFPVIRAALDEHYDGRTKHFEAAYRVRSRAGDWHWKLIRGRIVTRDESGRPIRIAGTQKDISRIKAVESALLELTQSLDARVQERTRELEARGRELESANDQLNSTIDELKRTQTELIETEKMASLGRLVAGVAHEVNTPLGVGVTALSFLRTQLANLRAVLIERGDHDHVEQFMGPLDAASAMAEGNLIRAANLVKSFKQVAVDQSSSHIRTVAVREYLDGTLQSLHPTLRKTAHEVLIDCDPALEMTSRPDALYQIVVNLVVNSLTHAFPPGVVGHIAIDAARDGPLLRLSYRDDGIGMEPHVASRVFEPFFTTKRDSGGSGLGMHIVYNLVTQALAGRVSLTTEPGRGVRVDIVFPRVHPRSDAPFAPVYV